MAIDTTKIGLEDDFMVPNLTESVSKDASGKLHITITNLSCSDSYDIESVVTSETVKSAKAQIVTGKMDAHNTFDNPEVVNIQDFSGISIAGDKLTFTIPACSVMHIEVEI